MILNLHQDSVTYSTFWHGSSDKSELYNLGVALHRKYPAGRTPAVEKFTVCCNSGERNSLESNSLAVAGICTTSGWCISP